MDSHSTVAIFVACFAVLVMVIAAQGTGGSMPGSVSMTGNMADEMVMPPGTSILFILYTIFGAWAAKKHTSSLKKLSSIILKSPQKMIPQ